MRDFKKTPCVIQRGGTSKGVYLHEKDLPHDSDKRKRILLAIFGSPDIRQIDGLGGADPLTSKCAIIGPSERNDADINYTMVQVGIEEPLIDFRGNCGNISAGVGPFAIDQGLIEPQEPETLVRVYNTNTKKILKVFVATKDGESVYTGNYAIDGVPGTGSKILLDYSGTGGTLNGMILPTGNAVDVVSVPGVGDVEVSIVDAGNPVCFLSPDVLGFSGTENPNDPKVVGSLDLIEIIRGSVSKLLGLAEDAKQARTQSPTLPMIAFVSKASDYASFTNHDQISKNSIDFVSRLFFMQKMHKTYPGTGTVCTGVAAMIDGTVVNQIFPDSARDGNLVRIGHPSGIISIEVDVENKTSGPELRLAAFGRTSRRIMEGYVYVPAHLFD